MVSMYVRTCVVCRSIPGDVRLLQADLDPDLTPQIEAYTVVYCTVLWCAALHNAVPWQLNWRETGPQRR